jgi:hypothetical protein
MSCKVKFNKKEKKFYIIINFKKKFYLALSKIVKGEID